MLQQANLYHLTLVSLWISLLMIGLTGCGEDEENEWVGTWTLETINGQSFEQTLAEVFEDSEIDFSVTATYKFDSDGVMEMDIEIEAEGEGVSVEGSVRTIGTYSLSGSNYTFTPIEIIEATGVFKDRVELLGSTEEDTGTWSRKGNTLTLTSNNGEVVGLKKK